MIIKSICKNPLKNAVYVVLLFTAFTPIILLLNTFFMGQGLMRNFEEFRKSFTEFEQYRELSWLFDIQRVIQSNMSSLFAMAVLVILLCILVLPFLQYILSLGRGYEIGVLRALGMGKGRAWVRLLIENILLMSSALILSLCATLIFHKHFAFSLLSIDTETEQILTETFSTDNMFGFAWKAYLYALCAAGVVTLISSALSNVLISNSAPLKLIQKHK